MALFNRQKSSNVPLELQPYYDAPRTGPRGWLMWIVRLVALLIVVGVLVVAGRWGWQKIDNNDKKVGTAISEQGKITAKPKSTAKSDNKSTTKTTTDKSAATVTPKDDSSSTRATSTPAASSSSSSSTTSPSSLVNTGPGATVALFTVVTVVGMALYQSFLRLKNRANL